MVLAACLGGDAWGARPLRAQASGDVGSGANGHGADSAVIDAREALRKRDRARLAALRAQVVGAQHPLASWVDYWELGNRLADAQVDEVEAFYARWRGHYVEDRLRNDWLLELGRRRDWAAFARDFPRFRMNDDREVTCYHLLTRHQAGEDVRGQAREAWFAQRDLDDGCQLLAATLVQAQRLTADDLWRKARIAVESGRHRAARAAVALADPQAARELDDALDNPMRTLRKRDHAALQGRSELALLATLRAATQDPETAAAMFDEYEFLPREHKAWAMAFIGRQLAFRLSNDAAARYDQAFKLLPHARQDAPGWSDDTLAWAVRSALRAAPESVRWPQVLRAIEAMRPDQRDDEAWVYWRARALDAVAGNDSAGAMQRAEARRLWISIAGPLSFYGKLSLEALGDTAQLPPPAAAPSEAERGAALGHGGLARALMLIGIGLRGEGVREWNYSLRGMDERALLAAAQLACQREVWDRCINTSDRTRQEIDLAQRFPMPLREAVEAKAREAGLDAAYVYGLIRQESRFVMDARSGVGASGLMQVMPATARWTARKIGLPFTPGAITDRDVNLTIGTSYLKLLMDDFGGSALMAAAAYNAGPNRPRRWREGATLEPAVWAENVPLNETRDYVKKVISNAAIYAALRNGQKPQIRAWLGADVGPREAGAPPANAELP
jgi:soluble lytic murein transglycosylase